MCPVPPLFSVPFTTDAAGRFSFSVPGGVGLTLYGQILLVDPGATFGVGISNCLEIFFSS